MDQTISRINFIEDWKSYITGELVGAGYTVDANEDVKTLTPKYYNVKKRRVSTTPRKVVYSDIFSCPPELKNGLSLLEAKLIKGEDVNPHLSKEVRNAEYNDLMMNDWGIFHFHLGETLDARGLIQRTGPLLFAVVKDSIVYCIDVFVHGAWTNQGIIEIIHKNWPEVIEQYKIKSVELAFAPRDEDIKKFRKNGMNSVVQVSDGTAYMPIGGGMMSNQISADVMVESIDILKKLSRKEQEVVKKVDILIEQIKQQKGSAKSPLDIHLEFHPEGIIAYDKTNEVHIDLSNV